MNLKRPPCGVEVDVFCSSPYDMIVPRLSLQPFFPLKCYLFLMVVIVTFFLFFFVPHQGFGLSLLRSGPVRSCLVLLSFLPCLFSRGILGIIHTCMVLYTIDDA